MQPTAGDVGLAVVRRAPGSVAPRREDLHAHGQRVAVLGRAVTRMSAVVASGGVAVDRRGRRRRRPRVATAAKNASSRDVRARRHVQRERAGRVGGRARQVVACGRRSRARGRPRPARRRARDRAGDLAQRRHPSCGPPRRRTPSSPGPPITSCACRTPRRGARGDREAVGERAEEAGRRDDLPSGASSRDVRPAVASSSTSSRSAGSRCRRSPASG